MPGNRKRAMACKVAANSLTLACLGLLLAPRTGLAQIDFARDVRPILSSHCWMCHGAATRMSDLRLDRPEAALKGGASGTPAIVPGDPARSRLLVRIAASEPGQRMPPTGPPLTAEEVELIRRWIEAGAQWPDEAVLEKENAGGESLRHWAFRRLPEVPLPQISNKRWVRTPVDRFILVRLESEGLDPNEAAGKAKLIRRLYFDLIGIPPSADQIDAFVRNSSPEAYERLVDGLLKSPHFGERWARHWLDAARYADSAGYEEDRPRPNAYHYRDFVIRAFNDDMPYDRFLQLQLAGDLLEPDKPELITATGFLTAGPEVRPDFVNFRKKDRFDELDDMIATVGGVMLGLTLGCARCHDHKFDPIPVRNYYGLLAFFDGTERYGHPLEPSEGARYERLLMEFASCSEPAKRAVDEWVEARTEPIRLERISSLEIPEQDKALLRAPGDKRNVSQAALLVRFSEDLKITDEELRGLLRPAERAVWDSLSRAVKEIEATRPPDIPRALGIREGAPKETRLLVRGDPDQEAEVVAPNVLGALTCESGQQKSLNSRIDLAEWMTDVDCGAGSLVARIIVNRLWQHHFGRGLVGTPGDFGTRGEPPTHPKLLEWLAGELVHGGWRLKPIHRLIVTSATYRQSGAWHESRAAIDPGNSLWWRREARRLEAEALRDAILAVSGTLNLTPFGPSVKPRIPSEAIYNPVEDYDRWPADVRDSPATWRRSVYVFMKRANLFPFLQSFGAPLAIGSCTKRDASTGPVQALALLNDEFVREQSRYLAERVLVESESATAARVETAYRLSLGRPPTGAELTRGASFLKDQTLQYENDLGEQAARRSQNRMRALADFCQSLFACNEFIYVD